MHVAARAERGEDVARGGGQPRQPEDRDALGEVDDAGLGAQPRAGVLEALGRPGSADALAKREPQARLPVVLAGAVRGPAPDRVGAVQRVAVEQVGEVTDGGEPPRSPQRIGGAGVAAEMLGEQGQPGFLQALVDDVEQRPDGALGPPRIRLGIDAGRRGHRVAHEAEREREAHVRADAVGAVGRRAQAGREALGDPALDTARRHGHDLGRERVGGRLGEQVAQGLDEAVGAVGTVDVEHLAVGRVGRGGASSPERSPGRSPI